jgi:hypothetical protein
VNVCKFNTQHRSTPAQKNWTDRHHAGVINAQIKEPNVGYPKTNEDTQSLQNCANARRDEGAAVQLEHKSKCCLLLVRAADE